MANSWDTDATNAMSRRQKLNTPWPANNIICKGCGKKGTGTYNPLYCNDCIKAAFDVLT